MVKKTKTTSFDRSSSKISSARNELERIEHRVAQSKNPTKTSVSQGIQSLKNQINNSQHQNTIHSIYWNGITDIYDTMARGIYDFSLAIYENFKTISEAGKADSTFNQLCNTAMKDSELYTKQLLAIQAKHKEKSGVITDPDELELYYRLGEEYQNLFNDFRQTSFQISTEITSYLASMVSTLKPEEDIENVVNKVLTEPVVEMVVPFEPEPSEKLTPDSTPLNPDA